jgi:hypothetical protein
MPDMTSQAAGVKQLRHVGHGIATAARRQQQPDERRDVPRKVIIVGPIAADVRLCLRPGTIEHRQESVVKHVQKAAEGGVVCIAQPLACVLREVDRQRTVGPEQSEQSHLQPRCASRLLLEGGQRARSESEVRILPEPDRFVGRKLGFTPARPIGEQTLDPPQRLVEVVAIWSLTQLGEERQSVGLAPACGIHRLISPRVSERSTSSVKALIETCRAK